MYYDPFNPLNFHGLDVVVQKPKIVPKIKLRESVQVSDEFRTKFNSWLEEMFGFREESILPKGSIYMFGNTLVMRPEQAAVLSNCSV